MALEFTTDKITRTTNISLQLDKLSPSVISREIVENIISILSKEWISLYGSDLLEHISPEDVEKAIKNKIAERFFGNAS